MIKFAPGLLFCLCARGLLFGADPVPSPSATPAPTPDNRPVALDAIAQLDLRTTTLAYFVASNPDNGFRWLSSAHDAAENTRHGLTLFNIPVDEVDVRFAGAKISQVDISFYNRGDSGGMEKEDFDALVRNCAQALTNFTKAQPVDNGKDATDAVKAREMAWQTDKARFLLESSSTRLPDAGFRAEFVRLTITAPEKPKSFMEESLASMLPAGAKFSGADHVKSLPNGDVLIQGIPMVDQGRKGYCVVASAERVMRYYGRNADEHELAELANSSNKKGTSPAAMLDSLKTLGDRLHVKTRTIEDLDPQHFEAMLDEYDKGAKRGQRAPELNRYVDDFPKLLQQINPEILMETRTKNPSEMDRFFRDVQSHINEGIPPLWSVMMGMFPKGEEADEFGGHMRLIIGYNAKTNEILYSDSWGYGHELSRMPVNEAWTITTGLYTIEPLE